MNRTVNINTLREAMRYCAIPDPESIENLEPYLQTARKVMDVSRFRITWRIFPVRIEPESVVLEGSSLVLPGRLAKKMLEESQKAAVLGATLGMGFEQELKRLQIKNMADALFFDAFGSAYIEQLLDEFEKQLEEQMPGSCLGDRFSCGYGDLPLEIQKEIADELSFSRRIGVFVHDSMMMTPSKSVSAVIPIADHPLAAKIRGCAYCSMNQDCPIRKNRQSDSKGNGGIPCGF